MRITCNDEAVMQLDHLCTLKIDTPAHGKYTRFYVFWSICKAALIYEVD